MTTQRETATMHAALDDVVDVVALDRRMFIKGIAFAVLTVQCLPSLAHTSDDLAHRETNAADNLVIHSSSGFIPHAHDLLIPYSVLATPPAQGVELTSTRALFHAHKVVLTRRELASIGQGGTITQRASSHLFVIALAKGQVHLPAGLGKSLESELR